METNKKTKRLLIGCVAKIAEQHKTQLSKSDFLKHEHIQERNIKTIDEYLKFLKSDLEESTWFFDMVVYYDFESVYNEILKEDSDDYMIFDFGKHCFKWHRHSDHYSLVEKKTKMVEVEYYEEI